MLIPWPSSTFAGRTCMHTCFSRAVTFQLSLLVFSLAAGMTVHAGDNGPAVFNVQASGATGRKADSAQAAIQKAIDACALAGGGTVCLPPGEYSSGTLHLRSHVRLWLEAGATLYSIKDKAAFD